MAIDEQPNSEAKKVIGDTALLSLKGRIPNGSRHVIVGGDTALQIPDGTSPRWRNSFGLFFSTASLELAAGWAASTVSA